MENQFLNEMLSDTLGVSNATPEIKKATDETQSTSESPQETVEQAPTNDNEIKNEEPANVEESTQSAVTEETNEVVNEQPTESVNEEVAQENTAWYDSEGTPEETKVSYTEAFEKYNINPEDPKSIVDAIEKAQKPDLPSELDNPVVKDFAKYIKDGGDIKEFMDTYVSTDVTTMSDKDVFVAYLKNVGAEGDELQAAIKDFDEMPKYKQRLQTQRLRGELESAQSQKLADLSQRQKQTAQAQREATEQVQRNVETKVEELVGTTYKGLKIDGNMAKAIKNEIINLSFTNKDGSVNIQKLLDIGVWMRYGQDLVKSNVTQAINKGRGQVIDKLSNPSKGAVNNMPNTGTTSQGDFAKDYLERGLLGRN